MAIKRDDYAILSEREAFIVTTNQIHPN